MMIPSYHSIAYHYITTLDGQTHSVFDGGDGENYLET